MSSDHHVLGVHRFAGSDGDQVAVFTFLCLAAIDCQPAGIDEDPAFGLEGFAFDAGDAGGDLVLCGGMEDGEEPLDNHVVELELGLGKVPGRLQRRNDRKVIGHLGVVENALVRLHPVPFENHLRKGGVTRQQPLVLRLGARFASQHRQRGAHRRPIVLRQRPRVRARVREDLVFLVQSLRQPKGRLGGESEAAVRLALQAREVIEQR
ncbi:MAG: hypothetical protein AW07_01503 [Candidatus Accumulibacter sp. SK-11]|nr:MAG: hypothetical protein AW07_01503 [Candidatus Accumulibacter sp. SK-11]